ncbi:MAG: hypothetical protein ACJ77K_08870 [Bacteroidia bacterium]
MRNTPLLKIKLFLILAFFSGLHSFSQNKTQTPDYSKHPYWIDMMNDPHVNYFEAIKAYDEFWKDRKKPDQEDDIIGQKKTGAGKHHLFKTREEREEAEVRKYALDVKKFEHWKIKVKPYVQEDGRILNADEQLELWKTQKQN